MSFKRIDAATCLQLISDKDVTLLDIRDPQSFEHGHINNALHVEEIEIDKFVEEHPKDKPLVIYCYHGNSSLSAADFFAERGFSQVYSLDGGYEGWKGNKS